MGYFSDEDVKNKENESYEGTMAPATRTGIVVNSKYVNVRDQARKDGKAIGQLRKDEKVIILGKDGDYFQIKYMNYPKAYVAAHLIEEQ